MEFLSAINDRDELSLVLHIAIDRIYKKEISKKLAKYSSELDFIGKIFVQYCSDQLTKDEMLDYFPVQDDLKECVFICIEVRKSQVCQHLIKLHNSSDIPLMNSFDWDLKFIIGNSSLASYREQRATIILHCLHKKESEMLTIELNRQMIDRMIQELEELKNC